jgi:hypothetical protein
MLSLRTVCSKFSTANKKPLTLRNKKLINVNLKEIGSLIFLVGEFALFDFEGFFVSDDFEGVG